MKLTRIILSFLALMLVSIPSISSAQERSSPLTFSDTTSSYSISGNSGFFGSIQGWLGGADAAPALLPPDEAFKVSLTASSPDSLIATLIAADGYYLYRDKLAFSVQSADAVIDHVELPPSELIDDPLFGRVPVYFGAIQVPITLGIPPGSNPDMLTLDIAYQGCNDPVGVCYPPEQKSLSVSLDVPTQAHLEAGRNNSTPKSTSAGTSESSLVRELFGQGNTWALIAAFFGFGLVLAFTPCMLPMIPILSGLIAGQSPALSRRHAFGLSLVYVLAMALTYALAGVAAGLAGTMLTAHLQNPWVLGSFAGVFVLLAFSMFGFYQLQMPSFIQSKLSGLANRTAGGKTVSVGLMGALSAIIVGPCVAAPLAGALLYIGQTGDVALGGVALFSMAIGMGIPLLVFGTTAGALLPKAGPWMLSVQRFFGVTLLAVAIYMISPIIPSVIHMGLWAALLIVSAMYLKALDPLPDNASGLRRFGKGVGVITLVYGLALLIGVLSGGRDILQPLDGFGGKYASEASSSTELQFERVTSLAELESQIQAAEGRYVMLDFWADWCVSCHEMERFTLSDERVKARLKDVLLLKADVTANNSEDQALLRRFGLFGPPGIIFFDQEGLEIDFQVIGFQSAKKFIRSLDSAIPL